MLAGLLTALLSEHLVSLEMKVIARCETVTVTGRPNRDLVQSRMTEPSGVLSNPYR